jgi:hypothetical protein
MFQTVSIHKWGQDQSVAILMANVLAVFRRKTIPRSSLITPDRWEE